MRNCQREGLGQFSYRLHEPVFAIVLSQDVFLRGGAELQARLCVPGDPADPVEAVQHIAADLVFLLHDGHGLFLVDRGAAAAATLSVGLHCRPQLVGQAQVVHYMSAGLVPEHAVDPCNRLHQTVVAHGFVDIHGVQTGGVEPGEPHIAHDCHLEGIVRVPESLGERFSPWLVAYVGLPVQVIRG